MNRLPLVDQFPYRFYPPRIGRFWSIASRPYNALMLLQREGKVHRLDVEGMEQITPLIGRGDGILITPNHPDHCDPAVLYEASYRVGRPFYYLAAYQLFRGAARHVLPRVGAFPIDREGADLRAFKAGVEILAGGKNPLVIFPEGEVYHTCDRLTPIREGAVAFATAAAKRLGATGRTVWIVPAALKYRFLPGVDPIPALLGVMDRLEARFTWWPRSQRTLVERIYGYGEGLMALKELEFQGHTGSGPLPGRIAGLRDSILDRIEDRRVGKRREDTVPIRVKELRKVCLGALTAPGVSPGEAADLRRDLNDLFVALQLFSYPGDYVLQDPSLERIAETLLKFEQDTTGAEEGKPVAPRRAILRFGEPIDVGRRLAGAARPRAAVGPITADLAARMQHLLDVIGPGRPIEDRPPAPSAILARDEAMAVSPVPTPVPAPAP